MSEDFRNNLLTKVVEILLTIRRHSLRMSFSTLITKANQGKV
jgi:hypothetical protein